MPCMKLAFGALLLLLAISASASTPPEPDSGQDLAKRYSRGNYALYFAGEAWSFALLGVIAASGLCVKFRDWGRKAGRGANRSVFLTATIFTIFVSLASFPLHIYRSYFREKRYGFSHQSVFQWLGDWAKGLGIGLVVGGLLITLLYAVARRFPRRYWLIAAGVAIAFLVATVAVEPVFLAPLFNKFTPLPAGDLRTRLLDLARSQGIPANDVFVVDASRRSSHTNAYVAGLLGTRRIVIYDTLLKSETPREVVATMGHEMGHYALHHVGKGIALASLGIFAACWLVHFLYPRLTKLEISDPAGLPLAILIVSAFSFLSTPIETGIREGSSTRPTLSGSTSSATRTRRNRGSGSSTPWTSRSTTLPRFVEFWLYTHPSLRHRIEFCELWRREHGYDSKP